MFDQDFEDAMTEEETLSPEEQALLDMAETDLENNDVEIEDFDADDTVEEDTTVPAPIVTATEDTKPAPAKKAPAADKGPSKKERALAIYNEMSDKGHARKDIIAAFMDQLSMSKAGASTYYQNCKTTWS